MISPFSGEPIRCSTSWLNIQSTRTENNMNIENKTVLITGANRGIGEALVIEALLRGAKRAYAGTRGAPLTMVDARVTPVTLDVTNASQIHRAARDVQDRDLLINNAGVAIYDDLSNPDVIAQHLAVN